MLIPSKNIETKRPFRVVFNTTQTLKEVGSSTKPLEKNQNKTQTGFLPLLRSPVISLQEVIPTIPKRGQILTWDDFSPNFPEGTWYLAWTAWKTTYNYVITVKYNKVRLTEVNVNTVLNKNKAWAQHDSVDDELLKHEQGHLDIAYIAGLDFKRRALQRTFSSKNYQNEIKDLYKLVMGEYMIMQRRYDKETEHYLNDRYQRIWNAKIDKMILELYKYW